MIVDFDEIEDADGKGRIILKTGQAIGAKEAVHSLPISAVRVLAEHKRQLEKVQLFDRENLRLIELGKDLDRRIALAKEPLLAEIDRLNRMVDMVDAPIGFVDVADFHEKFGVPSHLDTPLGLPTVEVQAFRMGFLDEELQEIRQAYIDGNLQKWLDGLMDLVYVAYGTALMGGVSPELWKLLWATVQRANMAKIRVASAEDSKTATGRGSKFDVKKPKDWVPPDQAQYEILRKAIMEMEGSNPEIGDKLAAQGLHQSPDFKAGRITDDHIDEFTKKVEAHIVKAHRPAEGLDK